MTMNRNTFAALAAVLISLFSWGAFGVFGFPPDSSASVKETLQPSGAVVLNDSPPPLFDTVQGESVQLLTFTQRASTPRGARPIFMAH